MSRENNSDMKFNELSGLDMFMDRTLQGAIRNMNRLQLPREPQHVAPSGQLSLEETNHYLLPILTLPLLTCNAPSSVCTTV